MSVIKEGVGIIRANVVQFMFTMSLEQEKKIGGRATRAPIENHVQIRHQWK